MTEPRCIKCGGIVHERTFVDGWNPDGTPSEDETYLDWYCSSCKIRWVSFHDVPEEGEEND